MMIKLGSVTDVNYEENISKFWLVKSLNLKKLSNEVPELVGKHYLVMGWIKGSGWMSVNNGTLKDMRAFIKQYAV